jgi:hypothetical protein
MAMTELFGRLAAVLAVLTLWAGGPAAAQENLDQGKTAAQLYASDCAICHKSPQALVKGLRFAGLDGFLRQHYTASRESAAAISAYLRTLDRGGPAAKDEGTSKRKANAAKSALPRRKAEPTPPDGKASESEASESKPSGGKPAEPDANAAAPEGAEAKAAAPKSPEGKTSDGKPAEPKPAGGEPAPPQATPAEPAPEAKPDKSD